MVNKLNIKLRILRTVTHIIGPSQPAQGIWYDIFFSTLVSVYEVKLSKKLGNSDLPDIHFYCRARRYNKRLLHHVENDNVVCLDDNAST